MPDGVEWVVVRGLAMSNTRNKCMGRFVVTVELANDQDLTRAKSGDIPPNQVRRLSIKGWVDTGAARLVIPQRVVEELGLPIVGEATVRYAGGQTARREIAEAIRLAYGGRSSVFDAVVEPDRDSALIGAIVLEGLDFVVDCTGQLLVPRDPNRILCEIE
jgi:predicted aspartyl protease